MSWLSDIFNPKKSKEQAATIVRTPTIQETPEYPLYRNTLESRMAGLGLGYDPNVLSSATAPYAQAERQGYYGYTVPKQQAQASAAGLGRSTIPLNQMRLGGQEVESSIGQKVANLQLANEAQKAQEKQSAISGYGNLLGADYDSIVKNVASQNMQNAEAARVQNANNQLAMTQAVGGLGSVAEIASPFLSMIPGVGTALGAGASILGGAMQNQSATKSAMVNTNSSTNQLQQLLKQLLGQV